MALAAGTKGRGRAATEPHHGGAARRSLRFKLGSWERVAEFTKSGKGRRGHLGTGVQKRRTAARQSIDCVQQSATHPLSAGVSGPKSKGRGQEHPTLTWAADHYSAGVLPYWGWQYRSAARPRGFGVMPGALSGLSG